MAIKGKGYFAIQTPTGRAYTRAGIFSTNADGVLVNPSGYPVLSKEGGLIALPTEAKHINIDKDGIISADTRKIHTVGITDFDNSARFHSIGGSLMRVDGLEIPAKEYQLTQYSYESSNVEITKVMTDMVSINRSFQQSTNMMKQIAQMHQEETEHLLVTAAA